MRPIFISYRRDDTEGQAGRLCSDLREVFGADNVFMDVTTIEPGVDFRRVIEKNTAACGVLLSLIGRDWIEIKNAHGQRRLDDPKDFVRLETAAALSRDIPVVPVLVQGARMPAAEELPDDLKDLSFRNSVELTHARWDSDVKLLIEALQKLLARDGATATLAPAAPTPRGGAGWKLPAGIAAVVIAAVAAWLLWPRREAPPPLVATVTPAPAAQVPTTPSASTKTDDDAAAKAAAAQQAKQAEEAAQKAADEEKARLAREEAARQDALRAEAARQAEAKRQAQIRAHNDGICVSGYVWRAARADDRVCVTPGVRSATVAENQAAAVRRSPTGGPYGPNTCKQGFVWREAYAGDVVCVPPASRQQAANDNAQAAQRVVPLPDAPATLNRAATRAVQ